MPELTEKKVFPAVHRCIYCGRHGKNIKLGDEHIVPFGLGGKLVLPKASCDRCGKITGATIERQCLRNMFGQLRIRSNYPTRRKKERPETLPMSVETEGRIEFVEAPVNRRPHATIMFAFPRPGILAGLTPEESANVRLPGLWFYGQQDEAARLWTKENYPDAKRHGAVASFHPVLFQKMLAKIAHSFAVAEIGYGKFNPLLPKAIIGEAPWQPGYLVGGNPNEPPPSEYINEIGFRNQVSIKGQPYLVVRIRLFANLGAPTYYVVVSDLRFLSAAPTQKR